MTIELVSPKVIDLREMRDRVKLRIGEHGSTYKYWLELIFEDKKQLQVFIEELNFQLNRKDLEYHGLR